MGESEGAESEVTLRFTVQCSRVSFTNSKQQEQPTLALLVTTATLLSARVHPSRLIG